MVKLKLLGIVVLLLTTCLLAPRAQRVSNKRVDFNKVVHSIGVLGLNLPLNNLISLFINILMGAVPFITASFGSLIMPLSDVFSLIANAKPSLTAINNAFFALNIGFGALGNLFKIVPLSFQLLANIGLSIVDILTIVLNTILNDLFGFLRIVELLNLNPIALQTLLLLGTDEDLFTFLLGGVFGKSVLMEIADILNIDLSLSGVLGFFGLFTRTFANAFTNFITNDFGLLIQILGLTIDTLVQAANILNLAPQILNLDFVKKILGLITGQSLFTNFISPKTSLTKRGNGLEALLNQLILFLNVGVSALAGGSDGKGIGVIFQDLGNFTQVITSNAITSMVFSTTKILGIGDLANCVVTHMNGSTAVGIAVKATYVGGMFHVPSQGIGNLVDGSPLVCSDFLVGILNFVDGLVFSFFSVNQNMKIVASFGISNPFFDMITNLLTFTNYYFWATMVNVYLALKDYVVN